MDWNQKASAEIEEIKSKWEKWLERESRTNYDSDIKAAHFETMIDNLKHIQWYVKKAKSYSLDNVIGVEEAARMLKLSPGTVKNYCAEGKILAKKIGKTWIMDKTNLGEAFKMETVNFEGKEYRLLEQAEVTGTELDGRFTNYHEAQNGETYDFEMSAPALDDEENEVTVYWMFEAVKGEEQELDSYDYDNVDRVE